MSRSARLQAARQWLPKYTGKNVVRGYAKWFGVDLCCAVKELRLLGVALDPTYLNRLAITLLTRSRKASISAPPAPDVPEGYGIDSDDHFAFIAGFTSGGAPFGTTWEESEQSDTADAEFPRRHQ